MAKTKGIRITDRDQDMLSGLYSFDGVLPERLVRQLYYPSMGNRTWRERRRLFVDYQYLDRPSPEEKHRTPEPIVWLGVQGIEHITQKEEVVVSDKLWQAALRNQTGRKNLRLELRRKDILWKDKPDWQRLDHQIEVCEFRLMIEGATRKSKLDYAGWITESAFRSRQPENTMTVRYTKGGRQVQYNRAAIPDGFFVVVRDEKEFAFLLELDRGTEHISRFVDQKVRPGVVYLESAAYEKQTRADFGRVIVITTGEQRALHLKAATEAATRKKYFYFTSQGQLTEDNFFTEPVWYLANQRDERGQLRKGTLPLLPPAK